MENRPAATSALSTDSAVVPAHVTAIVCAFNEGSRIGAVIRVLRECGFAEIIVVDDGSTDDTAHVAVSLGARVVSHEINQGKGEAMVSGVCAARTELLFFCDADITGLTVSTIAAILQPVIDGATQMMIGICPRWIYRLPLVLDRSAHISGQRALTRALWNIVPARYKSGFKIEAALNVFAKRSGGFAYACMTGVRHVIKERKDGVLRGFWRRLKMSQAVVLTYTELYMQVAEDEPSELSAARTRSL